MMRQFLLFRKVLGDEKRQMFIGRKKELEQLNAFYEDEKKKVACVTGSFGMGKTALLRHFIQDKNSVYFCAYETTRQQEISMFAHPLGIKKAKTMEDCLDKITTMSKKEKLLVVCNFTSEEQEFDLPKEFRGAECLIANMSNSYREEKMILKAYEAFVLRKK